MKNIYKVVVTPVTSDYKTEITFMPYFERVETIDKIQVFHIGRTRDAV